MNLFVLVLLFVSVAVAEKWAVIVAGSEGIWNYRHQADAAHAYHILIRNGYKPENIIVMAYNDVPNLYENPIKQSLYNHPGNNSINYYENYVVDYQRGNVTYKNYMKVLTGDASAGGKVLKSTEEDTIFLAYFDHGDSGVIGFPESHVMLNTELLETIEEMYKKKMYKRIVYYMEACYSGSMFETLDSKFNVYALTAANTEESSWAYYCDGEDTVVNGIDIGTCLGDEFSIKWMENVDEGNLKQTFSEHAEYITKAVAKSHVSKWGDLSFKDEPISEIFEGDLAHISMNVKYEKLVGTRGDIYYNKLNFYKKLAAKKNMNSEYALREYNKELQLIQSIDTYFEELISKMKKINKISEIIPIHSIITQVQCVRNSIDQVNELFNKSDYLWKYYNVLISMCEQYPNTPAYL